LSRYISIKTAWSKSFGMQKPLTSSKARERTHEVLIKQHG